MHSCHSGPDPESKINGIQRMLQMPNQVRHDGHGANALRTEANLSYQLRFEFVKIRILLEMVRRLQQPVFAEVGAHDLETNGQALG